MTFIKANNRRELHKKTDISDYAVIKRVCGGYACFETMDDYETWKNQN